VAQQKSNLSVATVLSQTTAKWSLQKSPKNFLLLLLNELKQKEERERKKERNRERE
jgi:hypothetical protein